MYFDDDGYKWLANYKSVCPIIIQSKTYHWRKLIISEPEQLELLYLDQCVAQPSQPASQPSTCSSSLFVVTGGAPGLINIQI